MSRRVLAIAFVALVAVSVVRAEIAPMSDDELTKKAACIVVGKVNGNYKESTRSAEWEDTRGVVEIAVESVERGEDVKPGDVVFARFWKKAWIKDRQPPPYGSGHDVYKNGTTVKAHLARNGNVYEILLPNGLQPVKKASDNAGKRQ